MESKISLSQVQTHPWYSCGILYITLEDSFSRLLRKITRDSNSLVGFFYRTNVRGHSQTQITVFATWEGTPFGGIVPGSPLSINHLSAHPMVSQVVLRPLQNLNSSELEASFKAAITKVLIAPKRSRSLEESSESVYHRLLRGDYSHLRSGYLIVNQVLNTFGSMGKNLESLPTSSILECSFLAPGVKLEVPMRRILQDRGGEDESSRENLVKILAAFGDLWVSDQKFQERIAATELVGCFQEASVVHEARNLRGFLARIVEGLQNPGETPVAILLGDIINSFNKVAPTLGVEMIRGAEGILQNSHSAVLITPGGELRIKYQDDSQIILPAVGASLGEIPTETLQKILEYLDSLTAVDTRFTGLQIEVTQELARRVSKK